MKATSMKRHAVKLSGEYSQSVFTWIITLVLTVIFLSNSFDIKSGDVNWNMFILSIAYALFMLIQVVITWKVKRDLIRYGEIQNVTRRFGFIQLFSLCTGNIFTTAFAFSLINKKKTPEYTFAVYMLLTQIFVIAISALNLFKPYVSDTFLPAMSILIGIAIFYLVALILVIKFVDDTTASPVMSIIAIVAIITALSGNVFALLLGYSLLLKSKSRDRSRIIKWNTMWGKITRNSTAGMGLLFIILLLTISVVSKFTFDYEFAVDNDYGNLLQSPSLAYPLGTDNFGRDLFSRIIFGARISLLVGFASTAIPAIIGGFLGAIAGYYSNRTDNIIMRLLDVLYAIPGILLAIAIIAAFGANTTNLIIALSVGSIPTYARTMRANVLMVSNYDFVDSARALGTSDFSIIFKQIVPNSLAPMIVKSTLTIGSAVIATSSLSYLGLGVEPHIPEWGNILKIGSTYLESHSYLAIFPGLAIIALVLSFNFLGDGLRDALDPKLD
ncbi:MAG TPA: ABC transporter permease [Sporosarcina psychrophila]|uniref:ABC transporter permease n=1 Tax=Sporosarcina psychrophila TaxID=1476 RepID=A0A921KFK6_SPOPS|nr:ABC transporter permease [Sporosarcina psychrophila]